MALPPTSSVPFRAYAARDTLETSKMFAKQAEEAVAKRNLNKALELYRTALDLVNQSSRRDFEYEAGLYRAIGELLRDDEDPAHTLKAVEFFRAAEENYRLAGRPAEALEMRIAGSSFLLDGKIEEVANHESTIRQLHADAVREREKGEWKAAETFAQLAVVAIRKWSVVDKELEAVVRLERARARAALEKPNYSPDFSFAARYYMDCDRKVSARIRFEELAAVARDGDEKRVDQLLRKLERIRQLLTDKQREVLDMHQGRPEEEMEVGSVAVPAEEPAAAPTFGDRQVELFAGRCEPCR